MKIYKIECEWDFGFKEIYKTRKAAEKALESVDWEDAVQDTLENIKKDGLVEIKEIEI